jgi:phosphoribosylanthranilate isomerase
MHTVRIKICGISCPEIADQSAQLGVDYIGLVFHPGSPRYIHLAQAKKISHAIKYTRAKPVAVFTEHTADEMIAICHELAIDTVQLHGKPSRAMHTALPSHLKKIYAVPIGRNGLTTHTHREAIKTLNPATDQLLFDHPSPGTGQSIATQHLKHLAQAFPYFIAGGLNINNIHEIIKGATPNGIDLSSGVESAPGQKSMARIQTFIHTLNPRSPR